MKKRFRVIVIFCVFSNFLFAAQDNSCYLFNQSAFDGKWIPPLLRNRFCVDSSLADGSSSNSSFGKAEAPKISCIVFDHKLLVRLGRGGFFHFLQYMNFFELFSATMDVFQIISIVEHYLFLYQKLYPKHSFNKDRFFRLLFADNKSMLTQALAILNQKRK